MQSYAIKSLVTCALGITVMAGCATQPSSSVASSSSVQRGTVSSIETASAAAVEPSAYPSSGGSAVGTRASGAPAIITVTYADGTQGRYISEQHSPTNFAVGDPVNVITHGDRMTIDNPRK